MSTFFSIKMFVRIGLALILVFPLGCDTVLPKRSAGEKLYRKHCAKCHGYDGAGQTIKSMGDPHANLLDDMWRNPGGSSGVAGVLTYDLVFEHPTFSKRLSQEEIKAIAQHVLVLRRERQP